jgi:hypothetical protein
MDMPLITEPYIPQVARWPASGRHILAQFDAESVVVYQAYRPEIGHFASRHGYFGGAFSLNRMSWIKPNFLWMMNRSGWGTREGQEVTLAVRLRRDAFDEILRRAIHSSFVPEVYGTEDAWKRPSPIPASGSNGTPTTGLRAIRSSAGQSNSGSGATSWPDTPRNGCSASRTSPSSWPSSGRM